MSQSSNGGCIKCHRFEDYTFLKPTACNVCGDMIWGFGLQCSDCIYRCHEGCKKKVVYHLSSSVEFNSEHTFSVASFGRVTHCNLCRGLVLGVINQGLKCGVCKYIVHNDCAPKVPNCCRVSAVSSVTDGKMAHHWVEGNMRPSAACEVCNKSCNALTLMNFMCAWCKKCVHTTCLESFNRECDFGIHSKSIIPPFCFINGAGASENEWVAHKLPYKPLIVFVNPKSGGQQGIKLLRKLQYLLNPGIQVYSLIPNGPTAGLAVIKTAMQNACQGQSDSNKAIDFRVLVCGGDGTAGWVLQAMAEIGLEVPVGIIPLGTGNDLARTLGWGPGYDGENLSKLLSEIEMAQIRTLDRWNITITPLKEGEVVKKIMTNYLSVGVDAKVALNFHLQREANPEQFKNRFVNKLWYTKFGAEAFFNGCEELNKSVTVEVDGKILELPKLEGVCIVNLPSYAAGTNLWGTTDIPKGLQQQAIDDCLLEVVGVEGSGHLGQIQTGLSHGIKLGQGHAIKITFHDTAFPVQVDGEPWMQTPACITITIRDQVPMLAHR